MTEDTAKAKSWTRKCVLGNEEEGIKFERGVKENGRLVGWIEVWVIWKMGRM